MRIYTDPATKAYGNATRACELAGYKGRPGSNQLAVQGHRLLRNCNIQQAVGLELRRQGFTPAYIAEKIMDATRATNLRVLPGRNGKRTVIRFPDHRTQLQAVALGMPLVGSISGMSLRGAEPPTAKADSWAKLSEQQRGFALSFLQKVTAARKLKEAQEQNEQSENPNLPPAAG